MEYASQSQNLAIFFKHLRSILIAKSETNNADRYYKNVGYSEILFK